MSCQIKVSLLFGPIYPALKTHVRFMASYYEIVNSDEVR